MDATELMDAAVTVATQGSASRSRTEIAMANADIPSDQDFGLTRRDEQPAQAWTSRVARWAGGFNVEGTIVLIVLLIAWQVAAQHFPPILFPSLEKIAASIADILSSPAAFAAIGTTYLRILIALLIAFLAATALGIAAGVTKPVDRAVMPVIEVMQGIPAVCWIIFAILWFRDMEPRIAFVVIVTTLPSFFYQVRDGVRGIPAELWDMVRAWRPSIGQLVRILVVPALLPALLTGWRINLGNGTRVTIMAELLGGVSGIGYQLRLSEELFRMDRAIAWTAVLVAFVVATNLVLALVDRKTLAWRTDRSESRD
jgi:NitT/TauT family transport system permease protein